MITRTKISLYSFGFGLMSGLSLLILNKINNHNKVINYKLFYLPFTTGIFISVNNLTNVLATQNKNNKSSADAKIFLNTLTKM